MLKKCAHVLALVGCLLLTQCVILVFWPLRPLTDCLIYEKMADPRDEEPLYGGHYDLDALAVRDAVSTVTKLEGLDGDLPAGAFLCARVDGGFLYLLAQTGEGTALTKTDLRTGALVGRLDADLRAPFYIREQELFALGGDAVVTLNADLAETHRQPVDASLFDGARWGPSLSASGDRILFTSSGGQPAAYHLATGTLEAFPPLYNDYDPATGRDLSLYNYRELRYLPDTGEYLMLARQWRPPGQRDYDLVLAMDYEYGAGRPIAELPPDGVQESDRLYIDAENGRVYEYRDGEMYRATAQGGYGKALCAWRTASVDRALLLDLEEGVFLRSPTLRWIWSIRPLRMLDERIMLCRMQSLGGKPYLAAVTFQ